MNYKENKRKRPDVTVERILELQKLGLTRMQIIKTLKVSPIVVYRRLDQVGLLKTRPYVRKKDR